MVLAGVSSAKKYFESVQVFTARDRWLVVKHSLLYHTRQRDSACKCGNAFLRKTFEVDYLQIRIPSTGQLRMLRSYWLRWPYLGMSLITLNRSTRGALTHDEILCSIAWLFYFIFSSTRHPWTGRRWVMHNGPPRRRFRITLCLHGNQCCPIDYNTNVNNGSRETMKNWLN